MSPPVPCSRAILTVDSDGVITSITYVSPYPSPVGLPLEKWLDHELVGDRVWVVDSEKPIFDGYREAGRELSIELK
jgi:hypothetical protein